MAMLAMQRRAWEQGTAAQALLELGETELAMLLARDAVVNQLKDGRLGLNEGNTAVTDPASSGEALLYTAKVSGEPELAAAAQRMLDYLLYRAPRTREGVLYHVAIENVVMSDATYMAPPFLAVAGYPEEAVRQIDGIWRILQDPKTGLLFHVWDDDRQVFTRAQTWGVGSGWSAAGVARVIKALPERMKTEKENLERKVRQLLEDALRFQREDGLFHDVIDDPSTFVETNAAQMFAYAMYRGVAGGWLEPAWAEKADRIREAVYPKVDEYGLVHGVCGAPHFNRSGTATEGQAFFLLMEAAEKDLRRG